MITAGKKMLPALQRGFTLIEMMVVVLIVALLASIGYPSYTAYIAKSHRQAAKNWAYQITDRQEQYFLDNRSYAPDLTTLGFAQDVMGLDADGQLSAPSVDDRYLFTIVPGANPATEYTVTMVPFDIQAQRDAKCGNLTLTHTGEQDNSGPYDDCW